jgi:hypothetical protein
LKKKENIFMEKELWMLRDNNSRMENNLKTIYGMGL